MVELCTARTRSGTLAYRRAGEGRPLILVHGLFTSGRTYDELMRRAPAGVDCVALDLPPAGGSRLAPGFIASWSSLAGAVIELADALELERFDLCGHSMGGGIAILAAARIPSRVRRLVLVDAVGFPFPVPLKGRLPLLPGVGKLAFALYKEKMFFDYFERDVFYEKEAMDRDKVREHYRIFDRRRGEALDCLRATADPRPVAARVPEVRCPALVVWGAHDRLVPLSVGRRLERELADCRLAVIPSAGHSPLEERPERSAAAIFDFLS